jgi:hypothetical protein
MSTPKPDPGNYIGAATRSGSTLLESALRDCKCAARAQGRPTFTPVLRWLAK